MIRVVLDTNVVVSAVLKPQGRPAKVLQWIVEDQLVWCVSEPILSEYREVLLRPKPKLDPTQVQRLLALSRKVALLFRPSVRLSVSPDEADNRFTGVRAGRECGFSGDRQSAPLPFDLDVYEGG